MDKIKTYALGAAEALGVGFVIGIMTVWTGPESICFTPECLKAVGMAGASTGVAYLLGYLRLNVRTATVDALQAQVNSRAKAQALYGRK